MFGMHCALAHIPQDDIMRACLSHRCAMCSMLETLSSIGANLQVQFFITHGEHVFQQFPSAHCMSDAGPDNKGDADGVPATQSKLSDPTPRPDPPNPLGKLATSRVLKRIRSDPTLHSCRSHKSSKVGTPEKGKDELFSSDTE